MAKLPPASVAAYLAGLPADRRAAIETVRKVIRQNLDQGFEEGIQYGMIGYFVPHSRYPNGYHCDPKQPLPFAALASQKNHMALYLMCLYNCDPADTLTADSAARKNGLLAWFKEAWAKTGKKLDMGKSCLRFQKAEYLAHDVIGELFKKVQAESYIAGYEKALALTAGAKSRKRATKKRQSAKTK